MQLFIDFPKMTEVFTHAAIEGRFQLFEHETYEILSGLGSESVPEHILLTRTSRLTSDMLTQFLGDKVVLKIVSEDIVHKSDVGGVKIVARLAGKVRSESRRMIDLVTENFAQFLEASPEKIPAKYEGMMGETLRNAINKNIRGVLVTQFLPPDSDALGNELLVSLRWTREFGMVITAGLGGTDTEFYAERFYLGQAVVSASTADICGTEYFEIFRKTIAYEKLSGQTRGGTRLVSDEQLIECFGAFIEVGNYFSPLNSTAPFVIDELEVNPFALVDYEMVPLDGLCSFSKPFSLRIPREIRQIGKLLHPQRVSIIGVSATKINFGRNILQNMLRAGYQKENMTIISPSSEIIDGVSCVPDMADMPETDLLIVALGAQQVPAIIEDVVDNKRSKSVILISGGLGETESSQEQAAELVGKISAGHLGEKEGPVFLGGNCLGVISRPGNVDSFFTPETSSPKRRDKNFSPVAFVSQSGAFSLVRMTDIVAGDPAYNITVGNQIDLTIGDCISWLAEASDIEIICVYAEGFQDLDGLHACRAIRRAVENDKKVLVYKAGRTPEGKQATSGHTASVAGDYMVCTSCLSQAGALVSDNLDEFDGLMNMATALSSKTVNGSRVGALSPAGFECVAIADSLEARDSSLELPPFSSQTLKRIGTFFEKSGVSGIMDIKNPLDVSPAGSDALYVGAVQSMVEDDAIDIVVTSLGSISPGTLDKPDENGDFTANPSSFASALPALCKNASKPIVVFNNAGRFHEGINSWLRDAGIPVFANATQAMTLLARYIAYRERLQKFTKKAELS